METLQTLQLFREALAVTAHRLQTMFGADIDLAYDILHRRQGARAAGSVPPVWAHA
jgi:hypothetical protein